MAISRTPSAAIAIYSYSDRGGSSNISSTNYELIIATKSIISISSMKTKSSPAGSFTVQLAPTRNWVTAISPGSWLEIHMCADYMRPDDIKESNSKTLKMIGRVDSVRMQVSVDQATGARQTVYTLEGKDWGQVFESLMYIDPYITNALDDPFQKVIKLIFKNALFDKASPTSWIFSSSTLVKSILTAWGSQQVSAEGDVPDMNRLAPLSQFALPIALAKKIHKTTNSNNLADNITYKFGRLSFFDQGEKYQDDFEAAGLINPNSLIGVHNIWQVLTEHSASVVNEMFCDMRWDGNKPQLALFKRPKPFWLSSTPPGNSDALKITSPFLKLRRTAIPKELIVSVEAGDNWRDIVNFIEVMPDFSVVASPDTTWTAPAWVKSDAAIYDTSGLSFARNGLKPLMFITTFFPPDTSGQGQPGNIKNWLPVMKQWYFDAHKMLNGTVSFMGLNDYIAVGENISFSADVLGMTNFVKAQAGKFNIDAQLVAHVESVTHKFFYSENGSRSYITTVGFVRGVFTDSKCSKLTNSSSFGIDTDAQALDEKSEIVRNTYQVDELK